MTAIRKLVKAALHVGACELREGQPLNRLHKVGVTVQQRELHLVRQRAHLNARPGKVEKFFNVRFWKRILITFVIKF